MMAPLCATPISSPMSIIRKTPIGRYAHRKRMSYCFVSSRLVNLHHRSRVKLKVQQQQQQIDSDCYSVTEPLDNPTVIVRRASQYNTRALLPNAGYKGRQTIKQTRIKQLTASQRLIKTSETLTTESQKLTTTKMLQQNGGSISFANNGMFGTRSRVRNNNKTLLLCPTFSVVNLILFAAFLGLGKSRISSSLISTCSP